MRRHDYMDWKALSINQGEKLFRLWLKLRPHDHSSIDFAYQTRLRTRSHITRVVIGI
jgi:hypothetical protein